MRDTIKMKYLPRKESIIELRNGMPLTFFCKNLNTKMVCSYLNQAYSLGRQDEARENAARAKIIMDKLGI